MNHLHIITLGVRDLSSSKSFYAEGFGWVPTPNSNENIVFYDLKGFRVALFPLHKLQDDIGLPQRAATSTGQITLAHTTSSEAETDRIFEKLLSLGAKAIKQPQKAFWGGYSGYLSDIDGHIWEIAYNPFLEFEENGQLK